MGFRRSLGAVQTKVRAAPQQLEDALELGLEGLSLTMALAQRAIFWCHWQDGPSRPLDCPGEHNTPAPALAPSSSADPQLCSPGCGANKERVAFFCWSGLSFSKAGVGELPSRSGSGS